MNNISKRCVSRFDIPGHPYASGPGGEKVWHRHATYIAPDQHVEEAAAGGARVTAGEETHSPLRKAQVNQMAPDVQLWRTTL